MAPPSHGRNLNGMATNGLNGMIETDNITKEEYTARYIKLQQTMKDLHASSPYGALWQVERNGSLRDDSALPSARSLDSD